jgi:hypothetical protein
MSSVKANPLSYRLHASRIRSIRLRLDNERDTFDFDPIWDAGGHLSLEITLHSRYRISKYLDVSMYTFNTQSSSTLYGSLPWIEVPGSVIRDDCLSLSPEAQGTILHHSIRTAATWPG